MVDDGTRRIVAPNKWAVKYKPLPMTHEPGGVTVIPLRNEPELSTGRSFSGDDRDTRHRASAHY